jgi:hypothetical protein
MLIALPESRKEALGMMAMVMPGQLQPAARVDKF